MRLRNIPRAEGVIATHPLVVPWTGEEDLQSRKRSWGDQFAKRQPLYREIGTGKGQFLLEMARRHPDRNFVGMERYTSVLLRAVEKADRLAKEWGRQENLRFLCADARLLPALFDRGQVAGIYLNFSDPWPKARHAKRRLTSAAFLHRYEQVLAPGGRLAFKTDNTGLFAFSLEELGKAPAWEVEAATWDLHQDPVLGAGNVMTEYEEKFSAQGNKICKLVARLREDGEKSFGK